MINFPQSTDSQAHAKINDLARLMDRTLTNSQYIDGLSAARLLGTILAAYRDILNTKERGPLGEDGPLKTAYEEGRLFGLVLAAGFDLICNAEYIHGRLVNSKWIYCHREGSSPRAYYSFLKQCPRCCIDRGLETRLSGAQHKPTSHHIGEITTVATALVLQLVAAANSEPFEIATITKQNHDVDAIGFREDLLVLFEIKASPMVSYPVVASLSESLVKESDGEAVEYAQHSLVDLILSDRELSLYVPHADWLIPLGARGEESWPYGALTDLFRSTENAAKYLSHWVELYEAYRVPKTERSGRISTLSYLVNGWGDEIDSNKTKPGLGRTDDIKKGTYQLLKFGAYYRDDSSKTAVRGALVANLDPLFLRADYVDKLADVRWGHASDFRLDGADYRIAEGSLRHLYDGIVTFNDPVLNDPLVASLFDFKAVEAALESGSLNSFLDVWSGSGPDEVVAEVAAGDLE